MTFLQRSMSKLARRWLGYLTLAAILPLLAHAQENAGPDYDDILQGFADSERWLTYSGDYSGKRHSPLTQINVDNIQSLRPEWTFQTGTTTRGRGFETTPLVDAGVLYVTGSNNYALSLIHI